MDKLVCPNCRSKSKDYTCSHCGLVLACLVDGNKKKSVEPVVVSQNPFAQITSISAAAEINKTSDWRKYLSLVLAVISIFLGAVSYWRFVYYVPDSFVAPVVLSANVENKSDIPLAVFDNTEKTIPLEIDLKSGNFLVGDLFQFVPQDVKMGVQAFNIEYVFEKYLKEGSFDEFKKEFDVSSDDLNTYFSDSFLVLFPDPTFDKWGFIIGVNKTGKDFVSDRVKAFNEKSKDAKDTYAYKKYKARLVEIKQGSGEEKQLIDELSSAAIIDKNEKEDNKDTKEKESKPDVSESTSETNVAVESSYFLLVSTSEDFLDEMKENSEGNLKNITTDVRFAKARESLPGFGQLFIFKQGDDNAWESLVGRFVLKFPYDGLEKMLNDYTSFALVFYSEASKLKISTLEYK